MKIIHALDGYVENLSKNLRERRGKEIICM
jgi:hypothetical protein